MNHETIAEFLDRDPIEAQRVKEHIKPERLMEVLDLSPHLPDMPCDLTLDHFSPEDIFEVFDRQGNPEELLALLFEQAEDSDIFTALNKAYTTEDIFKGGRPRTRMIDPTEPISRALAKANNGDENRFYIYKKEALKILEQVWEALQARERDEPF